MKPIKPKIKISEQDVIQNFENMLTRAYSEITPNKLRESLPVFILQNKPYLHKTLSVFIENAPKDFYTTPLALEIARIYEKYLDTDDAKKIAKKMCLIEHSTQKDAFVLLLKIARIEEDYTVINELVKQNPSFLKIEDVSGLYELVFYAGYQNDVDEVERLILKMLQKFPENQPVLQTAKGLALRYGLSVQFKEIFAKNAAKNSSKAPLSQSKEIEKETYDAILSENERALSAIALVDLTQGIAHEFGQPVTNIRFNIQLYLREFQKKGEPVPLERVESIFNDILKQTERIGELNSRLAPATSNQSNVTNLDFVEVLHEIIEQEQAKLTHFNITVEHLSFNKKCILNFDKTQLKQILTNLIINAIDSIAEKQKSDNDGLFKIKISIVNNEKFDTWNIVISDTGIGISDTIRTQIFNPFYTTKPPDKGQGLGLYIIKNILLKYGSTIRLDTKYTGGAKFVIRIPKKIIT